MDYKKMLQDLTSRVSPEDFAATLEISVSSVRQAALPKSTASARPAPKGWKTAAARLARKRAAHFQRLAERLLAER